MKSIKIIIVCVVFSFFQLANAQKKLNMRTIYIAGLIVDSENLLPIFGANICDNESEKILASSDENGYFKLKLEIIKEGGISFSLMIKGEKYDTIIQKENWGDLPGNQQTVYYFGLKNKNSEDNSFSEMASTSKGTSYEVVLSEFENVKEKISFNKKMYRALEGNDNVFVKVNNNYFIVSETGWIKLNTEEDLISINNQNGVPANKINAILKRRDIKNMSTTDSDKAFALIFKK